jgi:hypothetical protein
MADTSGILSETAVANMGAAILDEPDMASLDDTTAFARLCARQFGFARDQLLRAHPWSFNKAMAALAADAAAPTFRWDYAYTLPTDCLRLYTIREYNNGAKTPYELYGRKIYTDEAAPLNIIYGQRITNAALFDPLFAQALGARLAILGAQRITGKTNYIDKAREEFAAAMQTAVHVNALEKGSDDYVDSDGWDGAGYDVLGVRGVGFGGW